MYKKVESGIIINIDTLWQEFEQEWELNSIDNTSGVINPYRELIVNNAEKIELVMKQMEQWPILSKVLHYTQYDRHPKNYYNLSVNVVNECRKTLNIK